MLTDISELADCCIALELYLPVLALREPPFLRIRIIPWGHSQASLASPWGHHDHPAPVSCCAGYRQLPAPLCVCVQTPLLRGALSALVTKRSAVELLDVE